MHGQHNILAQTWWATISCNLWDPKTTEKVGKIVNGDWNMKRFTITKNSGKKAQTKDNTPHFNGPEGKIVLKRREEVLKIVIPETHADHALVYGLWEAQDTMFAAWEAPAPADPADWTATGDAAQKAAETYCELFTLLTSAADGTVTMHYAMFHWPDDIRRWGSLCGINAQGLEAANQESKFDGKHRCNRQTIRLRKDGTWTRGRAAQILAKAIHRQVARSTTAAQKVLKRHVPKAINGQSATT